MNNERGVGLAEILIALLLSSLTLMTLIRHYLNTKQHYHDIQRELEKKTELQLVSDLIRDSSRRAGFTPCGGIEHLITSDHRKDGRKILALEIGQGDESVLQINRMSDYFDSVLSIISPVELLTTDRQMYHPKQSVLIADCYHAEVQEISMRSHMTSGQRVILMKPLAYTYHAPVYFGAWLEEIYSIHAVSHKKTLYYQLQHAEELTTFVHELSGQVNAFHNRVLLHFHLGLDNAHQLVLESVVRTP